MVVLWKLTQNSTNIVKVREWNRKIFEFYSSGKTKISSTIACCIGKQICITQVELVSWNQADTRSILGD